MPRNSHEGRQGGKQFSRAAIEHHEAMLRAEAVEHAPRGSSAVRARSIITHARRLSAVIAAYRDALDREERRADRERHRRPF